MQLPQQGMSVDGLWFRGYMLLKNRNALIELSLLEQRCSFYDGAIGSPTDLVFDDHIGLVLQTAPSDDQCS